MTINIVADRSTHDHVGALKKRFSSITYYFNLVTVFIFTTTSKYVAERELSADNLEDILAAAAEPMQLIRFCVYYLPNTATILLTVYYWKLCQNTHLWRYD